MCCVIYELSFYYVLGFREKLTKTYPIKHGEGDTNRTKEKIIIIIIILKPSVNSKEEIKRELDERVIPIYSVGVSLLRNR